MVDDRRLAFLTVTPELLVSLLKEADHQPRYARVISGALPDDARFVRAGLNEYGLINLVIESESFFPVPESGALLRLPDPHVRVEFPSTELVRKAFQVANLLEMDAEARGEPTPPTCDVLRRLGHALAQAQLATESVRA